MRAVVLGIAQDGGVPHIGCTQELCVRARRDPSPAQRVAVPRPGRRRAGRRFLIDATPDIAVAARLANAGRIADPRRPVDGILLTHAHIGHYAGLMYLGREALGARRGARVRDGAHGRVPARRTGPGASSWPWATSSCARSSPAARSRYAVASRVTPVRVPHRDELSDTVGYRVRGPGQSLLYVPDIDKWEKWDRGSRTRSPPSDVALLDGTFDPADELPGPIDRGGPAPAGRRRRSALLAALLRAGSRFIHLNHTNRLLWDGRAPPRPRAARVRRGRATAGRSPVMS